MSCKQTITIHGIFHQIYLLVHIGSKITGLIQFDFFFFFLVTNSITDYITAVHQKCLQCCGKEK